LVESGFRVSGFKLCKQRPFRNDEGRKHNYSEKRAAPHTYCSKRRLEKRANMENSTNASQKQVTIYRKYANKYHFEIMAKNKIIEAMLDDLKSANDVAK
jgi:hypothetical protein